jgi:subtilisin family serine protease
MVNKKFKNLLLTTALATSLAACGGGGGGGGVPVSFDPTPQIQNLSLSTQIFGSASSVISLVRKLSEDQVIDATDALEAFKFVKQYNGTFDPSVLANYNIVIDGQTMTLEKGWYALVGYTKKYYDGKESFWNNLVTEKQYDDESVEYVAIEKQINEDVKKENLIDTLYETGKSEIVSTNTTKKLVSTTFGTPYKTGETVTIEGDTWTEVGRTALAPVTISTDTVRQIIDGEVFDVTTTVTRTDYQISQKRIDTLNENQARPKFQKYEVTTESVFSNNDKKISVAYQTVESVESLSAVSSTFEVTRTITETGSDIAAVTRNSVENSIVSQEDIDPIVTTSVTEGAEYTTTTYSDASNVETITIGDPVLTYTYTNNSQDVDNGDGTITRNTYKITYTLSTKTRTRSIDYVRTYTDVVKKDVTTVTTTTPVKRVTYLNGTTQDITGTATQSSSTVAEIVNTSTRTETINVSTEDLDPIISSSNNSPGELIATSIVDPSYTDDDPNLGTRTVGYSTDKTTYENNEYLDKDSNGSLQGWANGGKKQVKASDAYARGWTGKGVTIAVADTGYDVDHSEFEGQILATKDYSGTGINDNHGHGTHVLGSIVAKKDGAGTHGVAFDSKAVVIKIGDSRYVNTSQAAEGFSWAADQGASVGNLSANANYDSYFRSSLEQLSDGTYKTTDTRYDYSAGSYYNLQDPTEFKAATDKDMIIVNSAGNQGLDVPNNPGYFATTVDANGDLILGGKMLIVGAVDQNNLIASWSNQAGHICQVIVDNSCTDTYKVSDFYILAPGWTYSTSNDGSYDTMAGTSMAAPYVTGGVALIRQMWPYMKGENVVKLLTSTANKDILDYNVNIHGSGVMDLEKATRPVGAVGIPTDGRTTSSVSTVSLSNTGGSGSSVSVLGNITELSSVMIVDEFARDFYVDLTQGLVSKDTRKYSDVELAQYKSTWLPVLQSYGNFSQGGQFPVFTDGLELGIYSTTDGNGDWSSNISKKFKFTDKFSIKTTAGTMSEQETWLGNYTDGALAVGKNNNTNFGQIGVEYDLGDGFVSLDVSQGFTKVNTVGNSLITNVDSVKTESMKLHYEKKLTDTKKWGITYSIPNRITSGSANVKIPYATNSDGEVLYKDVSTDLRTSKYEKDIGFYFVNEGVNDTDWKTSFSIEYRNNIAGQAGNNKVVPGMSVSKKFWGSCQFLWIKNDKPFCEKLRLEKKLSKLEQGSDKYVKIQGQIALLNKEIADKWK